MPRWIWGAVALLAAVGFVLSRRDSSPERIVLIVVDTLRRDHVAPYDPERDTPNIRALAERGQTFPDAVASFHQTSMAMGALFTGRTPSLESGDPSESLDWNGGTWCGMARFFEPGESKPGRAVVRRTGMGIATRPCIPPSLPTLGERMREAGYWTIGVASNHFLFDPAGFSRGFDDWTEVGKVPKGVGVGRGARRSRTWKRVDAAVGEALARRPSDHFFLYVHYMDAHDYGGPSGDYEAGVARVDHAVGLLMERLGEEDLLDDAVVVFTADHGERLGEVHGLRGRPGHLGNPSFQEVLRVPLVIAPAVAVDSDGMVRVQDLHRLLVNLAGGEVNVEPDLVPGELFVGERRFRTYLRGRWKGVIPRDGTGLYLFDIEQDPMEQRNVAAQHPKVAKALRRRVDELSESLKTSSVTERGLSADDEERLRALGYLE